MKRIYSTIILLCCTTCLLQLTAQNQPRMSVRRGETQSPATTNQSRTTPARQRATQGATATPRQGTAVTPRTGTTGTSTTTAQPRTGTTGTATVTRPATEGTPPQQQVQPKARARQETTESESNIGNLSIRAQSQYTPQREAPSALIWKREVYRILDLTQEENAGLADPATPIGDRVNLFTLIFQLLADKKIPAYEYTLDGNVMLDNKHKADFKDILDRYHIYYRRKRIAATNDTVFVIDPSDIPSGEVLSYYIKEVWYYDQNNSSFHTAVTALCPVLHRSGDFDLNTVKYPMCWIEVSDLSPYMNQISISTSPYNNAATMGLDDFFALQMYKGDIYKTNNPSGKTLVQTETTDSAVVKERKLIQSQLESVEDQMWENQTLNPSDSTVQTTKSKKKSASSETTEKEPNTRRAPKEEKVSAPKSGSGGGNSAPKASVRRQRR